MTPPIEGFAAIPNWLIRDKSFSWRDRAVYMVLASRTGRDGTWAMSLQQIADEADMSVSSVQRARTVLRLAGAISWEAPVGETGKGKAVYRVHSSVQRPTDSRTGQSDLSAGQVNLTGPTGQSDPSGSVNLTSPDDLQELETRIGQSDQSGSVSLTDRKKNHVLDLPSVGVGDVAAQAPTTTTTDVPSDFESDDESEDPTTKRGTRLPARWAPTEASIAKILDEYPGVARDHLRAEHKKFASHWQAESGRNATKRNWNAAWRKWMRSTNWTTYGVRSNVHPFPNTRPASPAADARDRALNPQLYGGAS